MSALIKTYQCYLAQISHNFEWLSTQKLNSYLSGSVLDKFYMAIMKCGKSKIYNVVKELLELIAKIAKRANPASEIWRRLKIFRFSPENGGGMDHSRSEISIVAA